MKKLLTFSWLQLLILGFFTLCLVATNTTAIAQTTAQINYQAKLTNSSGVAVPNGAYNMRFWLVTTPTIATSSAVWTESLTGSSRVTVTNGLFSVMLGSSTPLSSVNFNQPLYLAVEIGGSGTTTVWDGEMSPRKILGTVPAAFEAARVGGVASTSLLRNDQPGTTTASSSNTLLSFVQNGAGAIARFFSGVTEVFTIGSNGNVGVGTSTPSTNFAVVGNSRITGLLDTGSLIVNGNVRINGALFDSGSATGTIGQILRSTGSGIQWVSTSTLGFLSSTTLNNSAALAALLSDETGTGFTVFNNAPAFSGTSTFNGLTTTGITATGTATLSTVNTSGLFSLTGTAANIALGSNYLSGDGGDEGIFVDGSGNVGIGTSTLSAPLHVFTSGGSAALIVDGGAAGGNIALIRRRAGGGIGAIGFRSTSNSPMITFDTEDGGLGWFAGVETVSGRFVIGQGTTSITAASSTFNITTAGNIGLGTTSPSARLTVSGDMRLTGRFADASSSTGSVGQLLMATATGTQWISTSTLSLLTTSTLDTSAELASLLSNETGTGSVVFSAAPTFTGLSNFQNGAGSGAVRVGADVNASIITAGLRKVGRIVAPAFDAGANTQILAADNDGTNNRIDFGGYPGGTAIAATLIGFHTAPGTTTTGGTERMTITGVGNVGIGTTSPSARLTIAGDMRLTGRFADSASSTGSVGNILSVNAAGNTVWLATSSLNIFDTSLGLANILTNETGTGFVVFNTNPTFGGMTATGTANFATLNASTTNATNTLFVSATSTNLALTRLNIAGDSITDFTGTGLTVTGNALTVATSTLGLRFTGLVDTPSALTANRIIFTNSSATSLTDTASLTFNNGTLGVVGSTTSSLGYFLGNQPIAAGSSTVGTYFFAGASSTSYTALAYNNYGLGLSALLNLSTGDFNFAAGAYALKGSSTALMTGSYNNAIGFFALSENATGSYNNALGYGALSNNATGSYNNALGYGALSDNTTGSFNSSLGTGLVSNINGSYNSSVGHGALFSNLSGFNNNAFGYRALYLNNGTGTIAIGYQAADNALSIDRGIFIGYDIDAFSTSEDDVLNIGNIIFGTSVDGTGTTLSSGNIGIGTSSPSARLTIAGDMRLTGRFADASSSTGAVGSVLTATANGTAWVATSSLGISAAGPSTVYLATTSVWTAGNLARVVSNGVVDSVGTSSLGLYGVLGNSITSSQFATSLTNETGTGSVVFSANSTFTGTQTFANFFSTTATITSATSTNLALTRLNIAGDSITDFTGTGLTVTGNTLTVATSTLGLASGFFAQGGNSFGTAALFGTNDNNVVNFETNGTINMTLATSGNLGIGTTSPSARLTVVGHNGVDGDPGSDAPLAFQIIGGMGGNGITSGNNGGKGGSVLITAGRGGDGPIAGGGTGGDINLVAGSGGSGFASNGGSVNITGGEGSVAAVSAEVLL